MFQEVSLPIVPQNCKEIGTWACAIVVAGVRVPYFGEDLQRVSVLISRHNVHKCQLVETVLQCPNRSDDLKV